MARQGKCWPRCWRSGCPLQSGGEAAVEAPAAAETAAPSSYRSKPPPSTAWAGEMPAIFVLGPVACSGSELQPARSCEAAEAAATAKQWLKGCPSPVFGPVPRPADDLDASERVDLEVRRLKFRHTLEGPGLPAATTLTPPAPPGAAAAVGTRTALAATTETAAAKLTAAPTWLSHRTTGTGRFLDKSV